MSFIVKTCTPRLADDLLLAIVEVADADEDGVLGQHLRREAADARQLGRLGAEQRRERHAVDVAAGRTSPACSCRRARRPRSGRAASRRGGGSPRSPRPSPAREASDRRRARAGSRPSRAPPSDVLYSCSQTRAISRMYFLLGSPSALVSGIGATRSPSSTTGMPSAGQPLAEAGDPKRRRPHVDAAAVAAEIERHADDVNRARACATSDS